MNLVYSVALYIYYFLLVFNSLLYTVLVFKKKKLYQNLLITSYLWCMSIVQFTSDYVSITTSNNLYFSHIFFFFHFWILGTFYYSSFTSKKQRLFLKYFMILTTIVILLLFLIQKELWFRFSLTEVFFTNYFFVVCALLYQYNSFLVKTKKDYHAFNTGVLIYSILSLSIFLFGNVVSQIDLDLSIYIWFIYRLIIISFHLTILYQWKILYYQKKNNVRSS